MNHLSHLSTLSFSGSDAKDFLQGQMTQDINSISDQSYKMTSILNPKGRIIVTGLIKEFKGNIFFIISKDLSKDCVQWLSRYILRSDVKISIEKNYIFGLNNENQKQLFKYDGNQQQLNISPISMDHSRCILLADDEVSLKDKSIESINESEWILSDIKRGLPILSKESSEKYIPQMINLDLLEGISFSKGCYTGQEVVARVQHRGKIKQRMFHITTESNKSEIEHQSEIMHENSKVGSLVNSIMNKNILHSLAVINIDDSEKKLILKGKTLNVNSLI
ncbi:MAG: hypothetical protein P8M55_05035 [Gammaproteobacteria bacterium]|jgi:hypothetical protein|nr:hypothetical protein [Gammaproteobacteria bacterium]